MSLWFSRTELNASRLLNIETTAGTIFQPRIFLFLKGYCSGQSHFSEINAKLAEENEFVTHFVQKCLETRKNEQNVVLNESSEALGNRSEIVRILVLAMTTADDGVGGSSSAWQVVARFSLFYKQNGAFWVR